MKKIFLFILFLLIVLSSQSFGKSYVDYDLNESPAITDTALGVTDPLSIPGWSFRNYLFSDIFALYLTQDFVITGSLDTTNATSNDSGPIALTPSATLVSAVDGKIFPFTGLAGFLSNSVFTMYDGTTPVYYIGIETPPTTTGETIGFNSVTGKWDIVTPSGGASITEVATAPDPWDLTPGNLTIDQATGTEYYLYADGSKVITRLADTSTDLFDLTLTVAETDGSTVDINGTSYGNGGPYTISSLTGSTAMDISYVTADTTDWTGTDSGDVTGTTPNFFIDMTSADKTLIATISEVISYAPVTFHWGAENSSTADKPIGLSATASGMTYQVSPKLAGAWSGLVPDGDTNMVTWPNVGDAVFNRAKSQVGFWLRPGATIGAGQYIAGAFYDVNNYFTVQSFSTTGLNIIWVGNGVTYNMSKTSLIAPVGEYYISYAISTTGITLYINGVEETGMSESGIFTQMTFATADGDFSIGGYSQSASSFDLAIFDQVILADDNLYSVYDVRLVTDFN